MTKKILITGANGQLGHEMRNALKGNNRFECIFTDVAELDICNAEAVKQTIADNHIDACGGIEKAVSVLREKIGHTVKIEVETRNLDEVEQALRAKADIIMLDNMDNDTMKKAVELIDGRALSEA